MKKLIPNLIVFDVRKTIDFYVKILDFEIVRTAENNHNELFWALIKNKTVELMFQSKNSACEEFSEFKNQGIASTIVLYIDVIGVNDLYKKTQNKVVIIKEIYETTYKTIEFSIKDINGYILTFAQDIK